MKEKLNFGGHLATFRALNIPQSHFFLLKTNIQKLSEQLQSNFETVRKTNFWQPKMSKKDLLRGKILAKFSANLNFWSYLSTFRADNTHKKQVLKVEKQWSLPKQRPITLKKSRRRLLWPSKGLNREWPLLANVWGNFLNWQGGGAES